MVRSTCFVEVDFHRHMGLAFARSLEEVDSVDARNQLYSKANNYIGVDSMIP